MQLIILLIVDINHHHSGQIQQQDKLTIFILDFPQKIAFDIVKAFFFWKKLRKIFRNNIC